MGGIVVSVENLEITIATSATTGTGTLTKSQTVANCVPFVTLSSTNSGADTFNDRLVDTTISGTTVTCTRAASDASIAVRCYVSIVEFDDAEVNVFSGTYQITGTSHSPSIGATLSATTAAFMVFGQESTNTTDDFNGSMTRGRISSTTALTFDVHATDGQQDGTWYVVEAKDGQFSVHHVVHYRPYHQRR